MKMGWVSGSACILKDHLVVYQNALHKSCKNIYFEQQDINYSLKNEREKLEREKGVERDSEWEGGKTDRDREKQRGWEGKRERREKLSKSILFYSYPTPSPHKPLDVGSHHFARVCLGQQWRHLGLDFLLRSPQSGWEDLHKSYPLLFSPPSQLWKYPSVLNTLVCRQTQVLWRACKDETGTEPQGRSVVNEEGPQLSIILAHVRKWDWEGLWGENQRGSSKRPSAWEHSICGSQASVHWTSETHCSLLWGSVLHWL